MTPSKSIPISPRSSAPLRVANSFQSSSLSEDFSAAAHHDEEVGVQDSTNILFGASDENVAPVAPVAVPPTILTGKLFVAAPRKVVKNMAEGQRVIFAFPSPSTAPQVSHSSSGAAGSGRVHVHSLHPTTHSGRSMGYGCAVISSILLNDQPQSTTSNSTSAASVIVHNPNLAGIAGGNVSDVSDDEKIDLTGRTHHAKSHKQVIRMLNFKKKITSVSYQAHLKPSSYSVDLNRQICARLPTFRMPRDALLARHEDMFRLSHDEPSTTDSASSGTVTPRHSKSKNKKMSSTPSDESTPNSKLSASRTTSPIKSDELDEATAAKFASAVASNHSPPAKSSDEEVVNGPSSDTNAVFQPTSIPIGYSEMPEGGTNSIGNGEQVVSELLSAISLAAASSSSYPTFTPPNDTNIVQTLDPYEKCLKNYDPTFLDNETEIPGKYKFTTRLPGYTSSIMTLKSEKSVRQEENDVFKNRHLWLTTDLKLSKLRSVKRKMESAAIAISLDIACTAFGFVYFEKLILRNVVSNHNARVIGGSCLLLAAKYYGLKVHSFVPLLKELGGKMKLHPKDFLAHEFFVFRKLKFSLFVDEKEVLAHFWKLRTSPHYRDKEFKVQHKERKKQARKVAAAAAAGSNASSSNNTNATNSPMI